MKTKLILLLFIILSINMQSQTKKAIVKKGATTAKKSVLHKTPITSSAFLGKNVEDVTNTLDHKFSELGYTTTKVNENKDFIYDNTYVKTDVIYHNYREIILDKGSILITSDTDYKVLNIEFNRNGNDSLKSNEVNKLLMLFNIDNQQLIEKKGQNRVFKLGNNEFAQVNGNNDDKSIYINVLKAENYRIPAQNIVVDSLTIYSSFENFQTAIIKVLQQNNLKLLWKEKRFVLNDWKYNFINYTDKYTFNEGVTLQFEVNKYNKKSVSISTKSPITMLKLERAFNISKWEHRYKARNSEINYYKNNRLLLESNKEENYISIALMPGEFEIDDRCNYGGDLSISMLEFIYNNFTDNDLRKYLIDHYLISFTEDNDHKITFDDKNQIIIRFNDDYFFTLFGTDEGFEDYGFKYLLDTKDSNINDQFKNDANNWDLATEDFNMKGITFNSRTQFYDKAKYTLMTTRDKVKQDIKKQQEEAGLLAEQRLEAERKKQEIIREREKAVKNAELTKSINKMNNALIDLLKK